MSTITNKLFNRQTVFNIRFVLCFLLIATIILITLRSLQDVSAATLFTSPETIITGASGVKELSIADLNNDQYEDIVAANYSSETIDVYINQSSTNATWNKATVRSNIQDITTILTADLDNDSDLDIISADTGSFAINWDVNLDGSGSNWAVRTVTSTAGAIRSMCAGDLNKDGNVDIVAADDSRDRIYYLKNNYQNSNSWESISIYEDADNPMSIFCSDIDHDGDIDVVSASQNSGTIHWHENVNGNGLEWNTFQVTDSVPFVNKIYVSDINNNSYFDIISTSPASSTVNWHKNVNGNGQTWESTTIYSNLPYTTDLVVGDLDHDGDQDILSGSNQSKNVIWIENNLPIETEWTVHEIGPTIDYPGSIQLIDVENDGDNDVIIGSRSDSKIKIAKNIFSQTSYNAISDIVNSTTIGNISVMLGQVFVSNNNLFRADNSVLVSVYDPNRNTNSNNIDVIPAENVVINNLNTNLSTNILLTETNVNSNLFIGEFLVDKDYSSNNITANDFDRIEVIYKKSQSIGIQAHTNTNQEYVIVDGSKPIISNLYPDENIKDVISDYTFQVIIEDSIIVLGPNLETVTSNIKFVIDGHSFQPNLKYLGYGKWQASLTISLSEDIHTWKLLSLDVLGNTAQSNMLTLEVDRTPPYFVPSGSDKARTGDTVINSTIAQSSNRKSIRLGFDDIIDGESVNEDGSDFKAFLNNVEIEIESAEWFNSSTTNKHIFLTLKDELPPDATPTIKLVGSIKDDAGNTSSFDKTVVSDGIKPSIQFTLSGTNNEARIITNDKLIVEVISDEEIINPNISSVVIQTLDSNNTLTATSISPSSFSTISPNTRWKWEYSFGNLSNHGRLYNASLQLQDFSGNFVLINTPDLTDNFNSTLFEVDTIIHSGSLELDTSPKPYSYINIDYSVETDEYTNDSHSKIQITESLIDGISMTIQTHNNKLFTISPPKNGWELGRHEVKVMVQDDAGNTDFFETDFNVSSEPLFTINLKPGFNLISLPANPSNPDINSVVPPGHPVTLIMTYDPTNGGSWLVSERNPQTNQFEGGITQIDASKAYLLRTNSFESLQVDLRKIFLHDGNLPTTISLYKGWNFVPVINISDQYISTEGVLANEYFKSINPTSILGVNQSNNLSPIDRNSKLLYGKGYLVYLDDDDILVPPK